MADSACYIELASNNGDFFTNSLTDDIMIRPQYASQKILIGTSNGQIPSLTVTSNNVGIGITTPTYKFDVTGYSRISETYTLMDDIPFGSTSTNRRYALLATLSYGNSFMRITGIAGGHDSGLSAQGKCKYEIIIDNRNVHIRGNVSNFFLNSGTGIVVYRDNSTNAFTVYLTGQNYYRHNIQVQNAAGSVQTSLSWSTDTTWTTPTGTTLWLDTVSMIPANCLGTEFYMSSASTPVYGITTLNSVNVGVGTSNPTEKFQVSGKIYSDTQILNNSNDSATVPSFSFKENSNTGIFHAANNAIGFSTGGTERLRIDNSGNVGISTTSPGYTLDVNGSTRTQLIAGVLYATNNHFVKIGDQGANQNNGLQFGNVNAGASNLSIISPIGVAGNWSSGTAVGDTVIRATTGALHIATGNGISTANMVLAGNNVGIGTSNPTYTLDVAGTTHIQTTNTTGCLIEGNNGWTSMSFSNNLGTSVYFGLPNTTGNQFMNGTNSNDFVIRQDSTIGRMFLNNGQTFAGLCLNSNNTIGIGTISSSYKLDVLGTTRTTSLLSTVQNANISTALIAYPDTSIGLTQLSSAGITTCNLGRISWYGYNRATPTASISVDTNGSYDDQGWIRFATSSGSGGNLSEKMCISQTGNVGIGTSSPSYKLDVSGDIRASGEIISTSANNFRMVQGNYGIFGRNDGTDYFTMLTNSGSPYGAYNSLRPFRINLASGAVYIGDTSLYVANAGNVGIGTSSPTAKLHINSGALLVTQCNNGTAYIGATSNGGSFISFNQGTNMLNSSSNWPYYGIGVSEGGMMNIQGFYGVRLGDRDGIGTITLSNYNVGVGTTNPLYKLDVNGTTRIQGNAIVYGGNGNGGGGVLSLRNTATANDPRWIFRGPDWGNNAGLFIGYNECNDTSFASWLNAGNPAMNIRAIGSYYTVGIGTSGNSTFGLQVNGTYGPYGNIANFLYSNVNTIIGAGDIATRYNGLVQQGDSLIVGYSNAINTGGLVLGTWSGGMSGIRVDGPTGYVGIGSSNPAYKLDVAGDIIANSWIRTRSNSGWYNESYSGGIYMTDTTWIRTYGTKNFYHDGSIMRTDGQFHVGNGGSTLLCSNGGDLSYRTNVLYANTSGNVGIGTSSPSYKLDVAGTINAISYNNVNYFYLTNQPSQIWRSDLLGTSVFSQGYFKIATLADTGNGANGTGVNIRGWGGGFGPKMKFECMVSTRGGVNMKAYVSGATYDSNTDIILYQESDNTFSLYYYNNNYYSTWWFEVSANTQYGATILTPSANRITPTGTLNTSMSSNLVTVTSGTNFAIGRSNPSYKLDVNGDAKVMSSSTTTGLLVNTSDVYTIIGNTAGGANYGSIQVRSGGSSNVVGGTAYDLYLQSDGGRIFTGSGYVGLGTTSPSYKLHVVGDVYATGDIIGFSDARLKSNITIIDNALAKIHNINGYTYNLPNDEKTHTGLIAQEVLKVLPEAVYQENTGDSVEGHYSLAYGNMAGLLVEAIKEIDKKYESKITDLYAQISILKNEIDILKKNSD